VRLRAIHDDSKALAPQESAPLRRACGHVAGDPAVVRRGYRFYRGIGIELGGFFTRRFTLEDGRGASVSLVAGIDAGTGAGVLDSCRTSDDAVYELACGPGSVWAVVLTLENATIWSSPTLLRTRPSPLSSAACRCSTRAPARCAASATSSPPDQHAFGVRPQMRYAIGVRPQLRALALQRHVRRRSVRPAL